MTRSPGWFQNSSEGGVAPRLSSPTPLPTAALTMPSSRVLLPISLSTWCSSKLSCSLEIIPGHFGGGGGGCDWPARVFASLCNTSLLLTAWGTKPSTYTTHFAPCTGRPGPIPDRSLQQLNVHIFVSKMVQL